MITNLNRRISVFIVLGLLLLLISGSARGEQVFHVLKIQGQLALVDCGFETRLKPGQRLIVKRLIGAEFVDVGTVKIIEVRDNRAAVTLIKSKTPEQLHLGDMLFTSKDSFKQLEKTYGTEGFRGITWGTDIERLQELDYFCSTGVEHQGMEFYDKLIDVSFIEKVEIDNIEYSFSKGKFVGFLINTTGESNFTALKDACVEKFGDAHCYTEEFSRYYWKTNRAIIILKYEDTASHGMLFIAARRMYEAMLERQYALDLLLPDE